MESLTEARCIYSLHADWSIGVFFSVMREPLDFTITPRSMPWATPQVFISPAGKPAIWKAPTCCRKIEFDLLLADKGFDADQRVLIPWKQAGKTAVIPFKAKSQTEAGLRQGALQDTRH